MVSQPWIAVAPVVVMMLALGAATIGMAQYQLESAMHETVPCGDEATERKLRELMHEALDEALKESIKGAFEVWMKDDTQQPERAARRVRGATNAYIQSHKSLAKWRLLPC